MKYLLALSFIVISVAAKSQKKELFYDWNRKPCPAENARFYSIIEKTDSGWFKRDYFLGSKSLQMQALYEDSACKKQNGSYFYFHANGKPSAIGKMVHGKQQGVYLRYHSNGIMADSALYDNGKITGSRMMWHRNGYMSDSIYHDNDSMDVQLSWFDDGAIASAGYLLKGKPYGKWKYYHHNSNPSADVVYSNGKPVSKTYYNEDGSVCTDTSAVNVNASVKKGGTEAWKKYLGKNLYWPQGYNFSNGTMAVTVVEFTINEDGKIENEEVVIPFHPEFDKIALRIIHNSPEWSACIVQNRKVKQLFRQPVTFTQQE